MTLPSIDKINLKQSKQEHLTMKKTNKIDLEIQIK